MNPPTDADLITAVWAVVDPVVRAARRHGPIPAVRSAAFLAAPRVVQLGALLVCGEARVIEDLDGAELVERWLGADYLDGAYHRPNALPLLNQIDRRRWPPTGDRALWVRYGPAGPPDSAPEAA